MAEAFPAGGCVVSQWFSPLAITFDSSGKFVYVPGTAYRIDGEAGVLTKVGSFKTGSSR